MIGRCGRYFVSLASRWVSSRFQSLVGALVLGLAVVGWPSSWLLAADSPAANPASNEPLALRVVTFNVLVDLGKAEGIPAWKDRKELCIQMLRDSGAQLIGLQEPTPGQTRYLGQQLAEFDEYHFHKGKQEYTDVVSLYRRDAFERLDAGSWWLSPTPDRPSTGFGNALPRLVIWLKLRHRASGRELYFVNTHFDNSMPSQVKMAALCAERLKPMESSRLPITFVGDFNPDYERGDYASLTRTPWRDAYLASPQASPDGRDNHVITMDNGRRIDHILLHGAVEAVSWQRLESPDPARRLSDHWPVMAELRLP